MRIVGAYSSLICLDYMMKDFQTFLNGYDFYMLKNYEPGPIVDKIRSTIIWPLIDLFFCTGCNHCREGVCVCVGGGR